MVLEGYYVKSNFFTGLPEKEDVYFYLTDGCRDSGNIARIKEVIVSIDFDKQECIVNIPNAFGKSPFIAEINVGNLYGINKLSEFMNEVKEWLGLSNKWRKIDSTGKQATFLLLRGNTCEIHQFEG